MHEGGRRGRKEGTIDGAEEDEAGGEVEGRLLLVRVAQRLAHRHLPLALVTTTRQSQQ